MSRLYIDKQEFERNYPLRCTVANLKSLYPDYVAIRRVVGGYMLFEFWSDYDLWMLHK